MKTILVFDTETTGLNDHDKILEIAWKFVGENEEYQTLLQPDENWTIEKKAFETHGITLDDCKTNGIPITDMKNKFFEAVSRADFIAGHNISFDIKMLIKFCNKEEIRILQTKKYYCTCEDSKKYSNKKNYGLKLSLLYKYFYTEEPPNQHRALGDVYATEACILQMLQIKNCLTERKFDDIFGYFSSDCKFSLSNYGHSLRHINNIKNELLWLTQFVNKKIISVDLKYNQLDNVFIYQVYVRTCHDSSAYSYGFGFKENGEVKVFHKGAIQNRLPPKYFNNLEIIGRIYSDSHGNNSQ